MPDCNYSAEIGYCSFPKGEARTRSQDPGEVTGEVRGGIRARERSINVKDEIGKG